MEYTNLLISKAAHLAEIVVNRPQALNALDATTIAELYEAIQSLDKDDHIRVIILTGAGTKAFVAGADIAYMRDMDALAARNFSQLGQRTFTAIERAHKPVIAAVNGYALGGGCELALACDIRLASYNARFGLPEVGLGVIPGFAGVKRLTRNLGKGLAQELLYTGDTIDAQDAWRIGLVNRVVASEELMDTARAMAQKIASRGQIAIKLVKQALNEGWEMDSDRAFAHEANLFGLCFSTNDQREGMLAFLEKRQPKFTTT